MDDDPRVAAARYRVEQRERAAADRAPREDRVPGEPRTTDAAPPTRTPTAADRAAYVETAIQQAMRRGEFDDLPGAGKPLEGLGDRYDPDWWIRRKIEREQLRGLGPPALTLRVEDAELADRLDALTLEDDVRAALDDFNRRVCLARMQLLGGPPVVTPLRDVEVEVDAWRARRSERRRRDDEPPASPRDRWWRRRNRRVSDRLADDDPG